MTHGMNAMTAVSGQTSVEKVLRILHMFCITGCKIKGRTTVEISAVADVDSQGFVELVTN